MLIFLLSCSKEVLIDLPEHKTEPVVNCMFTKDSIFMVHISKTAPVFDPFGPTVTEAIVLLYENGLFFDSLVVQDGRFYSSKTASSNCNYSIEVVMPGFEKLYAEDYLFTSPDYLYSEKTDSVMQNEEGTHISQLEISFHDNASSKNFYELVLIANYYELYHKDTASEHLIMDTVYVSRLVSFYEKNDLVIENEGLLNFEPGTLVFSDELFNGTSPILKVNFYEPAEFNGSDWIPFEYELIVKLRAISYNYYMYRKQLTKHYFYNNNDIWGGMGEPVAMFSNIENGKGIFAGFSEVRDTIINNNK